MFSSVNEPVIRIGKNSIAFSSVCTGKLDTGHVEILFNPVERMIVVRPCGEDHPNAFPWRSKGIGATSLSKIFYESMSWDDEYTYRIPCQRLEKDGNAVLVFDLDNFIGRAMNKTDEVIIARKEARE